MSHASSFFDILIWNLLCLFVFVLYFHCCLVPSTCPVLNVNPCRKRWGRGCCQSQDLTLKHSLFYVHGFFWSCAFPGAHPSAPELRHVTCCIALESRESSEVVIGKRVLRRILTGFFDFSPRKASKTTLPGQNRWPRSVGLMRRATCRRSAVLCSWVLVSSSYLITNEEIV